MKLEKKNGKYYVNDLDIQEVLSNRKYIINYLDKEIETLENIRNSKVVEFDIYMKARLKTLKEIRKKLELRGY